MKKGYRGQCLTCKYFSCNDGTAWCHAVNMREIYTTHLTDEERLSIKTQGMKKVIHAKKRAETMEKLLNKVNPSWCVYRKEKVR